VGFLGIHLWATRTTRRATTSAIIDRVRQLFPIAGDAVDLDRLYGAERPVRDGRPWVGVCMIATLDGSTVLDGLSGGLGNAGDRAVFSALRRAADVVLVGAATAAAERYRPARRAGQRIGVITRSGRIDTSTELFTSGSGFVIAPDDAPDLDVETVRAGHGGVDVAAALAQIGAWPSAPRFVSVEGGPTVNALFLDAGCVDELDLTIAPLLVGGDGARLIKGAAPHRDGYEPTHVLVDDDGYLFTRWTRSSPSGRSVTA